MALRTLDGAGLLKAGSVICGVGAGAGPTTFAVAERGCMVFAADRYLEVTPRSDVTPASMMVRPQQYTRRPLARGSVIPVHSDPRALGLPSGHFDGAFASGEIGRLGSAGSLAAAMEEIGRVLKPGGVASVVAEFLLEGPNGATGFDEDFLLLTPDLIQRYIVEPSGLELLDAPTFELSRQTYDARAVLKDFGSSVRSPRTVDQKKNVFPNLVIFHEGFLFCPIHLALRKPLEPAARETPAAPISARFARAVEQQAIAASGALARQIHVWNDAFGRDDDEIGRKNAEIVQLSAANATMTSYDQRRVALQAVLDGALHGPASGDLAERLREAGYKGFSWVEAGRWAGHTISTMIGQDADPVMMSGGLKGVLCYGPYVSLPRGRYRVEIDAFVLDRPRGTLECAVIENFGAKTVVEEMVAVTTLPKRSAEPRPVILQFDLDEPITNAEFRVISDSASNVAIRSITLMERWLEPVEPVEAPAGSQGRRRAANRAVKAP